MYHPIAPALITPLSLPSDLLTRAQAADYLGIKPQTLACWACNQRYNLPFVRIGRLIKYRRHDLDQFIEANRHASVEV